MNYNPNREQIAVMFCHPDDVDFFAHLIARAQAGEDTEGYWIRNADSIEDIRVDPSIMHGWSECRYVDIDAPRSV